MIVSGVRKLMRPALSLSNMKATVMPQDQQQKQKKGMTVVMNILRRPMMTKLVSPELK